jgi:hypothetical protein
MALTAALVPSGAPGGAKAHRSLEDRIERIEGLVERLVRELLSHEPTQ